jgi:ubiquinone/menaquinone biosynthesis C-methylase UbiE
MGYWRGRMFNRKAASRRSMPDEVLKALPLKRGDKVADIGAGGGYFTFKMAKKVGNVGYVYAVDTDRRSLDLIRTSAEERGLTNVKGLYTNGGVPEIPASSLDIVFMRNVCHHIEDPIVYFRKLRKMVKKNGIIAIIDYNGSERFSFHSLFHHSIDVRELSEWMGEAGYRNFRSYDFLPEQSFTLYTPN